MSSLENGLIVSSFLGMFSDAISGKRKIPRNALELNEALKDQLEKTSDEIYDAHRETLLTQPKSGE